MHPQFAYGQPPQRPGSPKTLGTLSIVFGALAIFGAILGYVSASMIKPPQVEPALWTRYLDDIKSGQLIINPLLGVMSIALIAIGVGQRGYKRWAPKASVYWAYAAVVVLVIFFIVHLTILAPAAERFYAEGPEIMRKAGTMSGTMAMLSLFLYLPYPIILWITFRKPDVVAAMTN